MPPTVWCAQHAVRFPLNAASVEQLCPAGHSLRLEGVTGYCPACDLHWDARQAEHPDACPYCQTTDATRRLCHVCERITYLPPASTDRPRCAGCGAIFDGEAFSHACRVLRTTVVTQRRRCPACREAVERPDVAAVAAPHAVSQGADARTAAAVRPEATPPTETDDAPAADIPEGIPVTTPVRARELHQRYLPKLIRVHFDYNLRRFFRNEKGLFYACGVGEPPGAYHIIPSWSRFGVAGDFVHWFSEIFDCDQPRGGDIWVHAPAVADAEGVLRRKGRLEVNRPPNAPPPVASAASAPEVTAAAPGVATDARPPSPERSAPPGTTAPPAPKPPEPASPTQAPPPARPRRRPWSAVGVVAAAALAVGGFGVWKAYVASPSVAREPSPAAPRSPASRPNQPQTEAQTAQEAVLKALDGLAQAFSAQQSDHYRSYFDAVLQPYYNRREGTAERAVRDMAALWETYAELVMTHEAVQVQLDPKGESATALTERTLTGRRRQTGEPLNDTTRVSYRFVRRGRYWLVAGVAEVKPTPDKAPRRKQK